MVFDHLCSFYFLRYKQKKSDNFFLLVMAAIYDFYWDSNITADRSDTFDTFLGPLTSIQRSELKIATDYCINVTGREGGDQGVNCVS